VIGRRRVPSPAPRSMAFMALDLPCSALLFVHFDGGARLSSAGRRQAARGPDQSRADRADAGIFLACVEHT